jgi:hypothetical protein
MKEAKLRSIIREVIEEVHNGNHNIYSPAIQAHFPYFDGDDLTPPNEIDTDKHYLVDKASAENNETYEWPQKEFDLGVSVEQKRSPELNSYDHAEIVVNNLRQDNSFYTKLLKL